MAYDGINIPEGIGEKLESMPMIEKAFALLIKARLSDLTDVTVQAICELSLYPGHILADVEASGINLVLTDFGLPTLKSAFEGSAISLKSIEFSDSGNMAFLDFEYAGSESPQPALAEEISVGAFKAGVILDLKGVFAQYGSLSNVQVTEDGKKLIVACTVNEPGGVPDIDLIQQEAGVDLALNMIDCQVPVELVKGDIIYYEFMPVEDVEIPAIEQEIIQKCVDEIPYLKFLGFHPTVGSGMGSYVFEVAFDGGGIPVAQHVIDHGTATLKKLIENHGGYLSLESVDNSAGNLIATIDPLGNVANKPTGKKLTVPWKSSGEEVAKAIINQKALDKLLFADNNDEIPVDILPDGTVVPSKGPGVGMLAQQWTASEDILPGETDESVYEALSKIKLKNLSEEEKLLIAEKWKGLKKKHPNIVGLHITKTGPVATESPNETCHKCNGKGKVGSGFFQSKCAPCFGTGILNETTKKQAAAMEAAVQSMFGAKLSPTELIEKAMNPKTMVEIVSENSVKSAVPTFFEKVQSAMAHLKKGGFAASLGAFDTAGHVTVVVYVDGINDALHVSEIFQKEGIYANHQSADVVETNGGKSVVKHKWILKLKQGPSEIEKLVDEVTVSSKIYDKMVEKIIEAGPYPKSGKGHVPSGPKEKFASVAAQFGAEIYDFDEEGHYTIQLSGKAYLNVQGFMDALAALGLKSEYMGSGMGPGDTQLYKYWFSSKPEKLVVGIDVGSPGSDKTVMKVMKGDKVMAIEEADAPGAMLCTGQIMSALIPPKKEYDEFPIVSSGEIKSALIAGQKDEGFGYKVTEDGMEFTVLIGGNQVKFTHKAGSPHDAILEIYGQKYVISNMQIHEEKPVIKLFSLGNKKSMEYPGKKISKVTIEALGVGDAGPTADAAEVYQQAGIKKLKEQPTKPLPENQKKFKATSYIEIGSAVYLSGQGSVSAIKNSTQVKHIGIAMHTALNGSEVVVAIGGALLKGAVQMGKEELAAPIPVPAHKATVTVIATDIMTEQQWDSQEQKVYSLAGSGTVIFTRAKGTKNICHISYIQNGKILIEYTGTFGPNCGINVDRECSISGEWLYKMYQAPQFADRIYLTSASIGNLENAPVAKPVKFHLLQKVDALAFMADDKEILAINAMGQVVISGELFQKKDSMMESMQTIATQFWEVISSLNPLKGQLFKAAALTQVLKDGAAKLEAENTALKAEFKKLHFEYVGKYEERALKPHRQGRFENVADNIVNEEAAPE